MQAIMPCRFVERISRLTKRVIPENLIGCSHHPLLDAHHVASGFSMSTVTKTYTAVVAVSYALTIAAAKGVIVEGP